MIPRMPSMLRPGPEPRGAEEMAGVPLGEHHSRYPREGCWTKRKADGSYECLPVKFHYDEVTNRLIGMTDPYGRTRTFSAAISQSMISANACNYVIATCPRERWEWVGPNQLGCRTPSGLLPLQHSIADIFAKRPDVEDFLMGKSPQQTARACTSCRPPSARTPAQQEDIARRMDYTKAKQGLELPQSAPGYTHPLDPYNVMPEPFKSLITGLWAGLTAFNPIMRETIANMCREGSRQEAIIQARLTPQQRKAYDEWNRRIMRIENEALQWHYRKQLYRAALKAIGVTEEEMLASSPYMPALAKTLGKIKPELAQAIEAKIAQSQKAYPHTITPSTNTRNQPYPKQGFRTGIPPEIFSY